MTTHAENSLHTPKTLVMKFGGTSVGSLEAMHQVVKIVRETKQNWPHLVVVISALNGVTNLLLDSAKLASQGDVLTFHQAAQELRSRHYEIIQALVKDQADRSRVEQEVNHLIADFVNLCQAISVLGEATPRALDAVASLGERMSVRVLAAGLESSGVPSQFVEATQLIITDDYYTSAHPDMELTVRRTRQVLMPILEQGRVPVVTGFIGQTSSGVITTLGRGGSDYSASLLGVSLPADQVWIWTDVNGVMTADPRLVKDARTIPELSYREVAELAYAGAKVLHPKSIRPLIDDGIPLWVCNTFNPSYPGTRLVSDELESKSGVIKAVTAIQNMKMINMEGRGMLGVPGVAGRAFSAVASTGTSVTLITQAASEQSICFSVPSDKADRVIKTLKSTFEKEISKKDIDKIWASQDVAIITLVGGGMRNTHGVSGRVFSAAGSHGINIIAIAQGSSEVSISMVVDAKDLKPAMLALHELIVETLPEQTEPPTPRL
jgi:aspartate kinase